MVAPSLSAQEQHQLVKLLVQLQIQSEVLELDCTGTLSLYGRPFLPNKGSPQWKANPLNDTSLGRRETRDPLLLPYLFQTYLLRFPWLENAPISYWQKRIQPFFTDIANRNFSSTIERAELVEIRVYALIFVRFIGAFFARGIYTTQGPTAPRRLTDKDRRRIDRLYPDSARWIEAGDRWAQVKHDWAEFKNTIINKEDGLNQVVSLLERNASIQELPAKYQNAIEYARIWAANFCHELFVKSPAGHDLYSIIKGIHKIFPYWPAKQLLKIANAEMLLRSILSMLFARPAGTRSLVQRIFAHVAGGEANNIRKTCVAPLKKQLSADYPNLVQRIEAHVTRGSRQQSEQVRNAAYDESHDVVTMILIQDSAPSSEQERQLVLDMEECFTKSAYREDLNLAFSPNSRAAAYAPKDEDDKLASDFAKLKLLLRYLLRARDRDQAVEMGNGKLVPALIKDSLDTVFYPIIRLASAHSNLSARLGDLERFLTDLLKTYEGKDKSLAAWISLMARHEQSLYLLFHECSAFLEPLWNWCQLGLDYMATSQIQGQGRGSDRMEVDTAALFEGTKLSSEQFERITAELDMLNQYSRRSKMALEVEMRCIYAGRRDADPKSLLDSIVPPDKEPTGSRGVRGAEMDHVPWALFDVVDPTNSFYAPPSANSQSHLSKRPNPHPPSVLDTRRLLGAFRRVLASSLPAPPRK